MADTVQARVSYKGHVQGVGFRFTARRLAAGFDVAGYVRNEPDGSVTLVAEGERGEVEALIGAVARAMAPHIREQHVRWEPATGEFQGFGVRHGW